MVGGGGVDIFCHLVVLSMILHAVRCCLMFLLFWCWIKLDVVPYGGVGLG